MLYSPLIADDHIPSVWSGIKSRTIRIPRRNICRDLLVPATTMHRRDWVFPDGHPPTPDPLAA